MSWTVFYSHLIHDVHDMETNNDKKNPYKTSDTDLHEKKKDVLRKESGHLEISTSKYYSVWIFGLWVGTLHMPEPLSTTRAATSSSHILQMKST